MEQIFLAILIVIIVKYGLFTISLKKNKGSYDFFRGVTAYRSYLCIFVHYRQHYPMNTTRRLLVGFCSLCVCVLLGGEVKMCISAPFSNYLFHTFMHIGGGKQQFAHTKFYLNEALLQFRRLLATIQYSEVLYVLK